MAAMGALHVLSPIAQHSPAVQVDPPCTMLARELRGCDALRDDFGRDLEAVQVLLGGLDEPGALHLVEAPV